MFERFCNHKDADGGVGLRGDIEWHVFFDFGRGGEADVVVRVLLHDWEPIDNEFFRFVGIEAEEGEFFLEEVCDFGAFDDKAFIGGFELTLFSLPIEAVEFAVGGEFGEVAVWFSDDVPAVVVFWVGGGELIGMA